MPSTPEALREVMSKFATGVTIVTVKSPDGVHGLTVNAFTSVSLEPPLVLICVQKAGQSHAHLSTADAYVVNLLSDTQQELAVRFATSRLSSAERFENVPYRLNPWGIPILEGGLGYLACRIVNRYEGGDHFIYLGEVEDTGVDERRKPLLFYNSQFFTLP